MSPSCNCVLVHRGVKTSLGSLASKTLHPVEPQEQFEPFEPVREFSEEPSDAASKAISSQHQNGSCLAPSSARSSALLSSLSPPRSAEPLRENAGATGKLNESIGASGDRKEGLETLGTPHRGIGALRGSPQFRGGFRGGMGAIGTGGRPSPASRLSFVDKKWLERCQVFGEMGTEEKPGAGNQERVEGRKEETETGREIQGGETVGKGEQAAERERRGASDTERDEGFKSMTSDKIGGDGASKPARQPTRKSKGGGDEEVKRKGGEETQRGLMSPPAPEGDGETSPKSKGTKKKGRKRQREGEDMEGEMTEEGGVKKKRRNGRKKEESSDVNVSPAQGGGKKRRAKKKGEGEEDGEKEKETKAPKKVKS